MSTEKPRPLTGYRETQETKKDTPVDPKKFQEAMSKVTESDQTEQGKKRHFKKTEEEGEEELDAASELPSPGAGFTDIMSGKSKGEDLLAPKTPQNLKSATTETNSSQFTLEHSDESEAPKASARSSEEPATTQAQASSAPPEYVESPLAQGPSEEAPAPEEPEEPGMAPSTPIYGENIGFDEDLEEPEEMTSPTQATQPQEDSKSPQRVQKKKTKDESLLSEKTKSTAQIAKEKEKKSPEIRVETKPKELMEKEETPEALPKEEAPVAKKAEKEMMPSDALAEKLEKKEKMHAEGKTVEPKPLQKQEKEVEAAAKQGEAPFTPKEEKDLQTPKEKEKISASDEAAKDASLGGKSLDLETGFSEDHEKSDDDEDKENVDLSGAVAPDFSSFKPDMSSMPETPAYTNLNPEVYELFERMVGSMMIQVHDSGHTQTTVTINMQGSVFDGSKIILDHYSSAPNSFNVEIATTPQGRELLMDNMNLLQASFEQSELSFNINQMRPVLLESYRGDFTRKEAASGDEDDSSGDGQQQRQNQ